LAINAFVRTASLGVVAVFDFDWLVRDPTSLSNVLTDYLTAYPHPKRAGHQQMASGVRIASG
jgi:hypothetical protein